MAWKNSNRLWEDTKAALEKSYGTLIVFDLETSGLSPSKDRIIELAAIRYRLEQDYNFVVQDTLHLYLNPGFPLPPTITELTGITDAMLQDAPTEEEAFDEIQSFFEDAVVSGYNIANFDNKFMAELYARYGANFSPGGVIDGIVLARDRLKKDVDVANYKLATCAAYYGIEFQAHSALQDAMATGLLLEQLLKEYLLLSESCLSPNGTMRPTIHTAEFWEGYRGYSRIYFNCDAGEIFFDIRANEWNAKAPCDISVIDMIWFEAEVARLLGIEIGSLKSWRGKIRF